MKARPRQVEREIAKCLSLFYSQLGMSPVERIPVLGRTGPDIEVNELKLAVDVKSRIQVPKNMIVPPGIVRVFSVENYTMVGVALQSLGTVSAPGNIYRGSTMVLRWLLHMQEWSDANACTAVLVLHRPKMMYERSTVILFEKDWRELWQTIK